MNLFEHLDDLIINKIGKPNEFCYLVRDVTTLYEKNISHTKIEIRWARWMNGYVYIGNQIWICIAQLKHDTANDEPIEYDINKHLPKFITMVQKDHRNSYDQMAVLCCVGNIKLIGIDKELKLEKGNLKRPYYNDTVEFEEEIRKITPYDGIFYYGYEDSLKEFISNLLIENYNIKVYGNI